MKNYFLTINGRFLIIKSLTVNKLFNLKIKMENNMKSHFWLKILIKRMIPPKYKKKQEKDYL
jgi:hypothetical protein